MKYFKISVTILLLTLITSCSGREPNDIAYVVALGFDKAQNDNYLVTIQYAKPTQISGGASQEGGKSGNEIVENLAVEAPDIHSAINTANHIVSKQFSLSHAKIIVFSGEVAREGIEDILETFSRNQEIRPDIYLAVSQEGAKEYLYDVKPVFEVNPARYYQLIYENNNSSGVPKNTGLDFYFRQTGKIRDNAVPLAGVIETKEESEGQSGGESSQSGGGQSGGQGSQSGGGQSGGQGSQSGGGQSGGQEEKNQNQEQGNSHEINSGFEFKVKDYIAGQVGVNEKNKSQTMGMVIFKGTKAVFEAGSYDTAIYKMLSGDFKNGYITLKSDTDKPVTVMAEQKRMPKISVDVKKKKIDIKIYLESDLYSMPADYIDESDIEEFEQTAQNEINKACTKFIDDVIKKRDVDILGFMSHARRKCLTNEQFYKLRDEIMNYEMNVDTVFHIRRMGLTIKESGGNK